MFKSSPLLPARATFYQNVLDIVQLYGDNGPNLYYTFKRCRRQEALTEWYDIIQPRQTDDDRSPTNLEKDIDTSIRLHDPRDTRSTKLRQPHLQTTCRTLYFIK